MKAKTVEQVYNELNARGFIDRDRVALMPRGIGFEEIAQTLSVGEPMSLDQAIEKMRAAVPDARLSIELEVNFSASSESVDIEYQVWNGREHFQGPGLKAAVELLLVQEDKFTSSKEEADQILHEAMAYQEQRL